ncbi:hypothetical protein DF185_00025 [Marinifilum breve]|uniref:Peptidase S74 domain-containing protein n=1 Tax=Marinifilum breve TaxID=2184082 RepID=A0A2V4A1L0_9BACT|nr:hypothetical protein [Marinifilum breve]PXY02516.1 hypothetical protein DF185_00025 [Marinifilum breve]
MKEIIFLMLLITLSFYLKGQGYKTTSGNTDYHHFVRTGGGAAVYINQVSLGNFPILRLSSGTAEANQLVKFSVENNGRVGIGTTNITEKLNMYIDGTSQVATLYGNKNTGLGTSNGFLVGIEAAGNGIVWNRENNFIRFGTNAQERMRITSDGKLGLGTASPVDKLTVVDGNPVLSLRGAAVNQFEGGRIRFCEYSNSQAQGAFIHYDASKNIFNLGVHDIGGENEIVNDNNAISIIRSTGNVGIGTQSPGSDRLAVNGTIRAKEIKVESSNWADFVFEDDYQLRNIEDLEQFISQNGHLPDIPNEKEVEKNGISLGEMNAKLLQKIEELTLYTIRLNKENQELKKSQEESNDRIQGQEKKMRNQEQKLNSFKALEERLKTLENKFNNQTP